MTEVRLRVESDDTDPARLDRITTTLYGDLRALGAVNVGRVQDAVAPGGKSGVGSSIAELVIKGTLSASTVTAVYKVITAYLERTKARSVTWIQDGQKIVVTAVSGKDQLAIIEQLAARADRDDHER